MARALARCDPAKRIRAKEALRSFPWLDEAASVVEAPALPDEVLERLRRTRLDGVQALALRSVVSTPKVSSFAKEADQLFEALDADSTGLVRRNEVLRLAHGRLRRVDLELAFDHADLAGDGVVTKDEFKCALLATRGDLVAQLVDTCVEIKILRRVRAESSHRPPRHRRDACSMAWRCRFLTGTRHTG